MEFIERFLKTELKFTLPLIVLSIFTRLSYFYIQLRSGLPNATDSAWYLESARNLLNGNGIAFNLDGILYLGYYGLLAVLLWLFKSQTVIVFIQVVINALSVLIVYNITKIYFNKRTALISGFIYSIMSPITFWSVYILTDSLFVTFILLVVYFLASYYERREKRYLCLFLLCSIYVVFLRPAGIISLFFVLLYIIYIDHKRMKIFIKQYRYIMGIVGAAFIVTTAYLVGSGSLNSLIQSIGSNMEWLLYSNYAGGNIYDFSTKYDYQYNAILTTNYFNNIFISFFINNWYNIIILYLKRLISFIGVWVWNFDGTSLFSIVKYFIRMCVLIPIISGIYYMIKNRIMKKASLILFVILSIIFFCVFFFMDVSYRYRIPSLAFIGIVAAYGVDRLLNFAEYLYRKYPFNGLKKGAKL